MKSETAFKLFFGTEAGHYLQRETVLTILVAVSVLLMGSWGLSSSFLVVR